MIEITQAQIEDAEAILTLQKLAYQSEAILYNDQSLPPLRQTLDELRAEWETNTILKAVEGEHIVGSVRAYQDGDTCHIGRLMVHPDFQGRGIGKALMRAIEDHFAVVRRFELFTGAKSEGNIRLYQSLGYTIFLSKTLSDQVTLVYMEKQRRD
jgi:ribosomal protein S18 acetylase RimI-like enzyme